jgi:hypothetical protein
MVYFSFQVNVYESCDNVNILTTNFLAIESTYDIQSTS